MYGLSEQLMALDEQVKGLLNIGQLRKLWVKK